MLVQHGQTIARLSGINPSTPQKPGLLKGELGDAFFEPLPENELRSWAT